MEQLIQEAIKKGIAYMKETHSSGEAWLTIHRNALLCGQDAYDKIMDGIAEGLRPSVDIGW